jgi:hypothetical protein
MRRKTHVPCTYTPIAQIASRFKRRESKGLSFKCHMNVADHPGHALSLLHHHRIRPFRIIWRHVSLLRTHMTSDSITTSGWHEETLEGSIYVSITPMCQAIGMLSSILLEVKKRDLQSLVNRFFGYSQFGIASSTVLSSRVPRL